MWAMYINADNCMESNMLLLLSLSKAQDIPHGLLESSGCSDVCGRAVAVTHWEQLRIPVF